MRVNVELIKVERIKRGWSRSDLAKRIGKSPWTVARVEQEKTKSPSTLKEIADVLNVPMEQLIKF